MSMELEIQRIKKRAAAAALGKMKWFAVLLGGFLFRSRCVQQLDGLLELEIFLRSRLGRRSRIIGVVVFDVTIRRHGLTPVTNFDVRRDAMTLNHLARLGIELGGGKK